MDKKNISYDDFKAMNENSFAPMIDTIKSFAQSNDLDVSSSFDIDPLGPHACYFCIWRDKRLKQFIRICAQEPFEASQRFYIDAEGKKFLHKRWDYSSNEGMDKLVEILSLAKSFIDSHPNG